MSNGNRDHCISNKLLHHAAQQDPHKGKLKIFLGIAPGVGKTFAMLDEARRLKTENVDLVVGLIDTHGRKEIIQLLENLTQIPPQRIFYKERYFDELDIAAIIRRHPQLVLVDELAHSAVHSSEHGKRWEAVIKLLNAGIDVYTTLNIQHIENLKEIIETVAEIPVRETVPEVLLSLTTSIQFIDITPDELLERLHSGKIYLGMQSKIAARNFFKKERLMALREIALCYIAGIVDKNLEEMDPSNRKFFQKCTLERLNGKKHPKNIKSFFQLNNINTSYFTTALISTIFLGINWLLLPALDFQIIWLICVIGALTIILNFDKGPAFLAVLVIASIWFFFFAPFLSPFIISHPGTLIFCILYTIAAIIAAILINRTIDQERQLTWHQESSQVLYEIVHHIINGSSTNETLKEIEISIGKILNGDCEIILKAKDQLLDVSKSKLMSNEKEKYTVFWVLENSKDAGLSTSTLPMSLNFYAPIYGMYHATGLIIYRPRGTPNLTQEQKNFLHSVSELLSLYLAHHFEAEEHAA